MRFVGAMLRLFFRMVLRSIEIERFAVFLVLPRTPFSGTIHAQHKVERPQTIYINCKVTSAHW